MKKRIVTWTLALVTALAVSTEASAALNAYLTLKGKTSGAIQGSVTQKGREGKIMVIAVDHSVKTPVAGKKQHGVFTITKELDKSTPLLRRAQASGEVFAEFELQFWTPQLVGSGGVGAEKQHYTVKLTNARIAEINFKMLNNKNPELTRYAEQEEISFTYEGIEWIWKDGGVSASDTP